MTEIFPGYLEAARQLGAISVNEQGELVNGDAIKSLMRPILRHSLRIEKAHILKCYPEIAELFQNGEIIDLKDHILQVGYFDGILPFKCDFDSEFYIATNPDVASAVQDESLTAAEEHWLHWGYREGRWPSEQVEYINLMDLL